MTTKNNIGEAILILGLIIINVYHPDIVLLIVSILLGIMAAYTWHSVTTDKETVSLAKQRVRAEINLLEAKTQFYKSKEIEKL